MPRSANKALKYISILCFLCLTTPLLGTQSALAQREATIQDQVAPTEQESNAASSLADLEIDFGGSLCPTCLALFRKRLLAVPGVNFVAISIKKKASGGQLPKVAMLALKYDPQLVSKEELIRLVRTNDFQFIKARQKAESNTAEPHTQN